MKVAGETFSFGNKEKESKKYGLLQENVMDKTIKELTLLLIYLTSWKEDVGLTKVQRSWKSYPFDVLDELNEEGYIDGNEHAKSVYLTEEGLSKVKELMKKYIGKEE